MSARKCKAHSSRTGAACARWAIAGGAVCGAHGGAAPQVKASAAARLQAIAMPAIAALAELLAKNVPPAVRLGAAQAVLDRTGFARGLRVVHGGSLTLLRERLDGMGEAKAERLAALLAAPLLDQAETDELQALKEEAGL